MSSLRSRKLIGVISDIFVFALVCLVVSRVQLFVTAWTGARQVPLSMEFPSQEYWSRLPFPTPGDLSDPGIELPSPELQEYSFFFFLRQILYLLNHWGNFSGYRFDGHEKVGLCSSS